MIPLSNVAKRSIVHVNMSTTVEDVHHMTEDLLKCWSLAEVEQGKVNLQRQEKILEDRKVYLEKQKDDVMNVVKVFQNWLKHLQKVN